MEKTILRSETDSENYQENKDLIFIKLNSESIIEIDLDPALSVIKKEHLQYINDQIYNLGGGKKMPVYISISGYITLDHSAKKYRLSSEYAQYRLANAFLIDTFSKALLYNFYLESNTQLVPVNPFSLKHTAFNWLKTFM